ncbi:iron-containing alcohol dehydrogenase [uncultured Actinomyces sp.]|uniref:aldehyde dehydrogenase family protein n=1 Tax=uncultured Actinomyces sp. TaxID=249061 RepID=UPI00262F12D6|nr:iron-containing alcohol dehydrogenase [uncultured Actinomyces sp.]
MTSISETINPLVEKALSALNEFKTFDQASVDLIVEAAAKAARDAHATLAEMAVEETRRGNFEDKTVKNIFAAEHVTAYMRDLKTVGVISQNQFTGITEIAEPVGVVAGITPVTNPTSTTIFKSLMCLKTRNPIIFAFHPGAQQCSSQAARIVYQAALSAGAPQGCIQWVEAPSMEATSALMNHEGVSVILATGGNAMVRSAYSCGKPALGVGAGNSPAYIHSSANLNRAVYDVVSSKAFDNGMICASEQAVILDEKIEQAALEQFKSLGCHIATKAEKAKLEKLMFGAKAFTNACATARLNPSIVGQSAHEIAHQAGFEVPEGTQAILAQCTEVSYSEPLTREKLSPVLAVLTAKDADEGIELAAQMVEQDGLGHTAAIHCRDNNIIAKFGSRVQAVRLVENAPTSQGAIGGLFNSFIPSLTLGCGSYGHNSVSNNVSAVNLINIKRLGRRNSVITPFQVPSKIFQGPGALRQLATLQDLGKITIFTDKATLNCGAVSELLALLHTREEASSIQIIDDIPRNLTVDFLREAASETAGFAPDTLLAFGATATINAAKFVRVGLTIPEADMADICAGRIGLPPRISNPRLICIPTTSGGQAALSAKASITDTETGLERLIQSASYLPSITFMDPELAHWKPEVLAARGFETISQATEALFSIHATDYTDALALHGLELAFTNLPRAVDESDHSAEHENSREKIISAGSLTSTALGNTSLGLADAIVQAFAQFSGTPRQDLLPAVLPNVVRFNGSQPQKLVAWPNYETFQVPARCEELTRHLGIKVGPEGAVEAYATALENLRDKVGLTPLLRNMGMPESTFNHKRGEIASLAFDYQSHSGNPQTARLEDIKELLTACFRGQKWSR